MKILAVDTALGALSAALMEDEKLIAEDWREMSRGHAEALAPMVDALMRGAGLAFAALDKLAVTTGPGTFTGQRVGIAFMRALALALKKPLIGVTTLDAMAEAALAANPKLRWAIAATDAKRGEIYLGARSREATLLEPLLLPLENAAARLSSIAAQWGERVAIAGTATELLLPLLAFRAEDSGIRQPQAHSVARLAQGAPVGPKPRPLYLRAPDAKLPGSA